MPVSEEVIKELIGESAITEEQYQLKTITPMFMHGWQKPTKVRNKAGKLVTRNNPISAEAREASFKGVLRYWWRAFQNPSMKIEDLFQKEINLFGGSGSKKESLQSRIRLTFEEMVYSEHKEEMFPHNPRPKVYAIPKGKVINLRLSVLKKDSDLFEYYKDLLDLMFHISGFGQRGRRGFGSLEVKHLSWNDMQEFLESVKTLLEKITDYQEIKVVHDSLLLSESYSRFPILRGIYLGKTYQSSEEALKAINKASSKVKFHYKKALGGIDPRRASPLHATVRKIGSGFVPVLSDVRALPETQISKDYIDARDMFIKEVR